MKSALLKRQAAIVAIVLFFAILAAAASILLINGDKLVKVAVVGGIFFPLVLYLSGNPRLFFLVGLVLAAPLGLSINFKTLIHIGGAPSYSVDLADFFLFPLVIFQIRDVIIGHYRDWSFPSINYWWLGLICLGLLNIAMCFRNFVHFDPISLHFVKNILRKNIQHTTIISWVDLVSRG